MGEFVYRIIYEVINLIDILLPIIGVVVGAILAYILNNRSAARNLSLDKIVNKKIELYEQLYRLFGQFHATTLESFHHARNNNHTKLGESLKQTEARALDIMRFFDGNDLYVDDDVILQIGATCMVPAGLNISQKGEFSKGSVDNLYKKYISDYRTSKELIKEYMGLKRIERHLTKINKPNSTSDIIDYAHKLEKEYRRK